MSPVLKNIALNLAFFAGLVPAMELYGREVQEILLNKRHTNRVAVTAFTSDGSLLASGSFDTTVKLWRPLDGRLIASFRGHSGPVSALAFSPDGRLIASGGWDTAIILRETATGSIVAAMKGHQEPVTAILFAANGTTLFSASRDGTIREWKIDNGNQLKTFKISREPVTAMLSDAGNRIIALTEDGTIRILDAETGAVTTTVRQESHIPRTMILQEQSGKLITMSRESVAVWDIKKGTFLKSISLPEVLIGLTAAREQGRVIAGSADRLYLVDYETGSILARQSTSQPANHLASSHRPGLVSLAHASASISFHSIDTLVRLHEIQGHPQWNDIVVQNPDRQHILIGGSRTIQMIQISTGDILRSFSVNTVTGNKSVVMDPAGKRIAIADSVEGSQHRLMVYGTETGETLLACTGFTAPLTSLNFNSHGDRIIASEGKGHLYLFDLDKKDTKTELQGHNQIVMDARFSPDDRFFIVAYMDNTIEIWKSETLEKIQSLPGKSTRIQHRALLSPDARLFASRESETGIALISTLNGSVTARISSPDAPFEAWSFSTDSDLFITGDSRGTASLWKTATGKPVAHFRNSPSPIRNISLSCDTRFIYSSHDDGGVTIHNFQTGNAVRLFAPVPGEAVFIAPDGKFQSSADASRYFSLKKNGHTLSPDLYWRSLFKPGLYQKFINGESYTQLPEDFFVTPLPRIAITSHWGLTEQKTDKATITFSRTIDKPGLKPFIYLNGSRLALQDADPAKGSLTATITLEPGVNLVTASLFDPVAGREGQSNPVIFHYQPEKATRPHLYILSFGVENYASPMIGTVPFAEKDITAFNKAFTETGKDYFSEIHTYSLTGKEVTPDKIKNIFKLVGKVIQPQDTLIVLITGRGQLVIDPATQEAEIYYLTHQADPADIVKTAIPARVFTRMRHGINVRKTAIFIATSNDISLKGHRPGQTVDSAVAKTRLATLAKEQGLSIICTTRGLKPSQAVPSLSNSLFVWSLIESLRQPTATGFIRLNELFSRTRANSRTNSRKYLFHEQAPVHFNSGNDFILGIPQKK